MRFWRRPRPNPMPHAEQRIAELATIQAVTAFVGSGVLPLQRTFAGQRKDGLSGARALLMLEVHAEKFSGNAGKGIAALQKVRKSLRAEIDHASRNNDLSQRQIAHLRKLDAFATGLWAYRSAEAKRTGAVIDDDRVASEAERAASSFREEPYLRERQAQTFLLLGRADEAARMLETYVGAPWLGSWKFSFEKLLAVARDQSQSQNRGLPSPLPAGSALDRLRAMSEQPGWIEQVGQMLPGLLVREALDREPLIPRSPTFDLELSESEDPDSVDRLIGKDNADPKSPTIAGLQTAIEERFGVELPFVWLKRGKLPGEEAVVTFEGRVTATTQPDDMALAERIKWWPGVADTSPALRALLLAVERNLQFMIPSLPDASHTATEVRALMLADRMPYRQFAERAQDLIVTGADPVSAVAALRLPPADGTHSAPLWGYEAARTLLLLDHATEAELQDSMIPHVGAAIRPATFAKLTSLLRDYIKDHQSHNGGAEIALVVRDLALRPLIQGLFRNSFPDIAVLALPEMAQDRALIPLGAQTAWRGMT